MNDRYSSNSRAVRISKSTHFIDEEGTYELANEVRSYTLYTDEFSHDMLTEENLYSDKAQIKCTINEANLKRVLESDKASETPGGYQIVEYFKKINDLQNKVTDLEDKNMKNSRRLMRAISFAEKVKASKVGRLFFGRNIKALEESINNDKD